MALSFAPLFSGSSGNCVYVGCGDDHVLVDAGVSGARILAELERTGIRPMDLSGILVTHEHVDHIKAVGILSRKLDIPVYATAGTWNGMDEKIGAIPGKNRRVFTPGEDFYIGRMEVRAFSTPHDALEPVGYSFCADGGRFSVATDIGCLRESWLKEVRGSNAVLLESNYEPGMLEAGSYPYVLKQRIAGRKGHLCNADAGKAALELVNRGARRIILGHLSKENNYPDLALQCTDGALREGGVTPGVDMMLNVARRDGITGFYSLEREELL